LRNFQGGGGGRRVGGRALFGWFGAHRHFDWTGVLQRVAVCCSVLQCVAVCCSVLRRGLGRTSTLMIMVCCNMLECVAECYRVLQCVAVYCRVLQGVAVWLGAHGHYD